jgi:hypothetical protein
MLLPADLEPALDTCGAAAMARRRRPSPDAGAFLEPAVRGQRVVDGQKRGRSR